MLRPCGQRVRGWGLCCACLMQPPAAQIEDGNVGNGRGVDRVTRERVQRPHCACYTETGRLEPLSDGLDCDAVHRPGREPACRRPAFPGVQPVGFDYSTVEALQEDDQQKHARVRADVKFRALQLSSANRSG